MKINYLKKFNGWTKELLTIEEIERGYSGFYKDNEAAIKAGHIIAVTSKQGTTFIDKRLDTAYYVKH